MKVNVKSKYKQTLLGQVLWRLIRSDYPERIVFIVPSKHVAKDYLNRISMGFSGLGMNEWFIKQGTNQFVYRESSITFDWIGPLDTKPAHNWVVGSNYSMAVINLPFSEYKSEVLDELREQINLGLRLGVNPVLLESDEIIK